MAAGLIPSVRKGMCDKKRPVLGLTDFRHSSYTVPSCVQGELQNAPREAKSFFLWSLLGAMYVKNASAGGGKSIY